MATSDNRIPANQVGLLFVVLLGVWVGWIFIPGPAKPTSAPPPPSPPSKLQAVGLPDNPDWDGMPEMYAVWAAQRHWPDGKVQFAYWNPMARAYADFFEATQTGGKVRFRVLSKREALQGREFLGDGNGDFFRMEKEDSARGIPTVDFGTDSPTHPFVFFTDVTEAVALRPKFMLPRGAFAEPPPLAFPTPSPSLPLPPLSVKPLPPSDGPSKK